MCVRTHTHTTHVYTYFLILQPERYVLDILKRIRSSELEESLLVMPFDFVVELLHLLKHWLDVSCAIKGPHCAIM